MSLVLKIANLSKTFKTGFIPKKVEALNDLSLEVETGEIFGLLGPNGAGKTTTIKCILGLIYPDRGSIEIMGEPAHSESARSQIGFLTENPYVYDFLTGREYLTFFAKLHGMESAAGRKRADELLEMFGLQEAAGRQLRKYSKGMLQRIGLAQALVSDPQFLVFDEPMSGLDPVGRKEVRDLMFSLKNRGRTLLFSSHILSDAEMICDRIAILVRGKLQMIGKLPQLMKQIDAYEVTLSNADQSRLNGINCETIAASDSRLLLRVPGVEEIDRLITLSKSNGFRVDSIVPQRQTLEDLFLKQLK